MLYHAFFTGEIQIYMKNVKFWLRALLHTLCPLIETHCTVYCRALNVRNCPRYARTCTLTGWADETFPRFGLSHKFLGFDLYLRVIGWYLVLTTINCPLFSSMSTNLVQKIFYKSSTGDILLSADQIRVIKCTQLLGDRPQLPALFPRSSPFLCLGIWTLWSWPSDADDFHSNCNAIFVTRASLSISRLRKCWLIILLLIAPT